MNNARSVRTVSVGDMMEMPKRCMKCNALLEKRHTYDKAVSLTVEVYICTFCKMVHEFEIEQAG